MLENSEEAEKIDQRQGTIFIVISAIGFGLIAIFAKYAYEDNVGVFTLLTLRFLLAGLFLGLILWIKKEKLIVERRQLLKLIALGIMGYAVMSSFFFNAVKLIPASIVAIIFYTYPVIVTLLSFAVYKEPITKNKIAALLLSFVGLMLVVGVAFEGLNLVGVFYSLGAAVVYSLYITFSGRIVKDISANVVSFYIIVSAGIAFMWIGLVTDSLEFNISIKGWFSIIGLAFFSTGVAIISFFKGMHLLGPSKASIISTVEPIVTTLAAFALFQEHITLPQFLGGSLVVLAVIQIHKDS